METTKIYFTEEMIDTAIEFIIDQVYGYEVTFKVVDYTNAIVIIENEYYEKFFLYIAGTLGWMTPDFYLIDTAEYLGSVKFEDIEIIISEADENYED